MLTPAPKFTVILPLHDHRGIILEAIAAWVHQRGCNCDFQIVVIDAGQARLARRVAKLLAPDDRVVHCQSTNEATLYNAGAAAATSNWLVFSESHVLPEEGAVAALEKRFMADDCDAALLGSTHGVRSRFSRVDAALGDKESSQTKAMGLWRTVGLRGFAIRKEVFASLGTFNEEYFRFAETALAIHLVDRGFRLSEFNEVKLRHYDIDSLGELLTAMTLGRLGNCRFWDSEPELAHRYFGGGPPLSEGSITNPSLVRSINRAATMAICKGRLRCAWRLWRVLHPFRLESTFGWEGAILRSQVVAYATYLKCLSALYITRRHEDARNAPSALQQYSDLRRKCARPGVLRYQRELEARQNEALDADQIYVRGAGFFPPENWQGHSYCWSLPSAAILIPQMQQGGQIRIDARPTGGWLVRRPRLYIDGKRIPNDRVSEDEGILTIDLDTTRNTSHTESVLSWDCQAFVPASAGLPDSRKLGIAMIDLKIVRNTATSCSAGKRAA